MFNETFFGVKPGRLATSGIVESLALRVFRVKGFRFGVWGFSGEMVLSLGFRMNGA